MSLEIVRQVAQAHPELLRINRGSTCYQHTAFVVEALQKAGHAASFIGKTAGEGQYTPPGFTPRTVAGLDGKPYIVTGVSHDAIYCDGQQIDTLAKANDGETPIYEADGTPMTAVPVWNAIPREYWRPQNPPIAMTAPAPPAPTPPPSTVLSKGEVFARLQALNAFYAAPEGLQRPGGLVRFDEQGRTVADMEAIAQWFYQLVIEGVTLDQVFTQIRSSDEWRGKHPTR